MCAFGNKCDVNEIDLLEYLAVDPETKVIAMHLEDINDGQQFMNAARRVVARKPVLVLKPGRSESSVKAVASHTGSLVGDDKVYDSAFKQAGVIRLNTLQELLEIPRVFASQRLPAGNRVAIVTLSGGAGIMAIDAAMTSGLSIAQLASATTDRLAKISPRIASNPVDVGQLASLLIGDYIPTLESIIATVLADNNVDCAFIVIWATSTSQIPDITGMFSRLKQQASKPMTVWIYTTKLSVKEELSRELEALGLPVYIKLETAVKALGIAVDYAKRLS